MTADLMRCGMTLDDVPRRVGWDALAAFVSKAGPGSATYDDAHPEMAGWGRTEFILADIFDAIARLEYTVASALGGRPRMPKPYPRPRQRHVLKVGGKGTGVPISEFDDWWRTHGA